MNLDIIGLEWLNDLLFQLIVKPISRHLFLQSETKKELDWRNGYVAGYSSNPTLIGKPRSKLVAHTDDSEVTMNICLSDADNNEFKGGLLEFYGLRGESKNGGKDGGGMIDEYQPEIGKALLHAGRHFHAVSKVESGDRYVYVIWARSYKGSRAQTCPCCWLNRRVSSSNLCICGDKWN